MKPRHIPKTRSSAAARVPVRRGVYVAALDGVRALAVAGVFLLHLSRNHVPGGAFGVDVFFVLSAFLITRLLLQEVKDTGRIDFRSFYWRRAFRLLPALVLWIGLATVTAVLAGQSAKVPWSITSSLFYFSDFLQASTDHVGAAFDQAWSLAVEEQFYMAWPLLLVCLLRLRPSTRRLMLNVLVVVAVLYAFTGPNYFLPTGHLLPLVIGCWAADQMAQGYPSWISRLALTRGIGPVAITIFVIAALTASRGFTGTFVFVSASLATAALVLNATGARPDVATVLLKSAVLRWVGERSYGVYLYGLTLIQTVPLLTGLRLTFAAPLDVVVTVVVVALSYRFVESPIRRRGRLWLNGGVLVPSPTRGGLPDPKSLTG